MPNDVKKAIKKLSIGKACGIDNVSVAMLRKLSAAIADILAVLFNRSIDAGIFPDCFKQALVVPIHKKGDIGEISNYRPVALLPIIGKLFEQLVHCQLSTFLTENQLSSLKINFCQISSMPYV